MIHGESPAPHSRPPAAAVDSAQPARVDELDGAGTQLATAASDFLACAVVGGPEAVRAGLQQLADATQADEFMLVSDVFDPALRLRSLDIAAEAMGLSEPVVPAATIP